MGSVRHGGISWRAFTTLQWQCTRCCQVHRLTSKMRRYYGCDREHSTWLSTSKLICWSARLSNALTKFTSLHTVAWWMEKRFRVRCLILHCWCFTMPNDYISSKSDHISICQRSLRSSILCDNTYVTALIPSFHTIADRRLEWKCLMEWDFRVRTTKTVDSTAYD